MKKLKLAIIIIATIVSATGCMAQNNLQPQLNPGQWQPGFVYFVQNNVSQTQAYAQSNGYVDMIQRTVPTIDQGWAYAMVQFVQVAGGPVQTAMCIYRKSRYTEFRDIPFGINGKGYIANFSNVPLGCTSYNPVPTIWNGLEYYQSQGQKIYIRID